MQCPVQCLCNITTNSKACITDKLEKYIFLLPPLIRIETGKNNMDMDVGFWLSCWLSQDSPPLKIKSGFQKKNSAIKMLDDHKFNQNGYCKFGQTCTKIHIDTLCMDISCDKNICSLRHPRACKYFLQSVDTVNVVLCVPTATKTVMWL